MLKHGSSAVWSVDALLSVLVELPSVQISRRVDTTTKVPSPREQGVAASDIARFEWRALLSIAKSFDRHLWVADLPLLCQNQLAPPPSLVVT